MKILESRYGIESVDELAEEIGKAVKRSIQRMHEEKGWCSLAGWNVQVVVDGDILGICVNLSDEQHCYAQKVLSEEYRR